MVYLAVRTLACHHAGHLITGGFTLAAAGVVLLDNRVGRQETINIINTRFSNVDTKIDNVETKINNVQTKINNVEAKTNNVETKIDDVKAQLSNVEAALRADIKDLGVKVRNTRSMVLESGHHITKAPDGDKRPMRERPEQLERSKGSNNEDCGSS
ncbi:hypothetical protein HOY82DRAFT_542833 [Tuber indicum]|nr:hypothetical protein HOY82DRAFT_542833 [Tuber indicum]